ncbi:hypothetical protein RIF29_43364 [Crotalaria pallida]|uniref:Uncharacterized protein n=1 Tax=Crotalaria pallida TaxID=3830 RepID=A0AAN9E2A3_CROPI
MEESPHKALGQIGVALNALFWAKLLRDFGECISLLIAKLFPSFRTEGSPCPEESILLLILAILRQASCLDLLERGLRPEENGRLAASL